MINLDLTNSDARQLAKVIRAAPVASVQWIADQIATELDSRPAAAPWRKVVKKGMGVVSNTLYLHLECGHRKTYSGDAAIFDASDYKRVRCDDCRAAE